MNKCIKCGANLKEYKGATFKCYDTDCRGIIITPDTLFTQQNDVREDGVEKLAYELFPKNYQPIGRNSTGGTYDVDINYEERRGFIKGYQIAKENTYTEEQVREAIDMAYMFGQAGHFVGEGESCTKEIIQSLKQHKQ